MARAQAETGAQRGRLRRWLAVALVAGVIAGGVAHVGGRMSSGSTLPVRLLRFSGELDHFTSAQLRDTAAPYAGHGFLAVDVDGMRGALESLPWVREAAVKRVWPDVVEIQIRAQHPLARWGEVALLNDEGELFTPPAEEWPDGLPVFAGPEGSAPAMAQRYRELREVLSPVGLAMSTVELSERRAWSLRLDNGLMVLLGRDEPQPRLERFVRAYGKTVADRNAQVTYVDLRYTNGFAVAWKKGGPA